MQPWIENRIHAFTLFPFQRMVCREHLHSQIEILFPLEGELLASVDSQTYTLTSGEALMVFPNHLHSYPEPGCCSGMMLIFEPSVLPPMGVNWETLQPESPHVLHFNEDTAYALRRLHAIGRTNEAGRETLALVHLLMAGLLNEVRLVPFAKPLVSDILYTVLMYIADHYSEEISLCEVARQAGCNEYHLSHLLNARLHMGFRQYVNRMRVNQAQHMLLQSNALVEEIGSLCGFASLRSFDRAFSQVHQCTPSEYRKRNLASYAEK